MTRRAGGRGDGGAQRATDDGSSRLPSEPLAGMLSSALAMERDMAALLRSLSSESRDSELRGRLEDHLAVTRGREAKVREVFEAVDVEPAPAEANRALTGIADMHRERLATTPDELHDVAVAVSTVAFGHFEMSLYETIRTMADAIDSRDVVTLVDEILAQERQALNAATMAVHRLSRSHVSAIAPPAPGTAASSS